MYGLSVDKNSTVSIVRQLTHQLRSQILSGAIPGGLRLQATRSLAQELGVSRNTIIQVYDQLIAEGYLNSVTGSGTFVAQLGNPPARLTPARGAFIAKTGDNHATKCISFDSGTPDCGLFPRVQWARALKEACLDANDATFGYGRAGGEPDLQRELRGYLYRSKGIECAPEQITILPGATSGVDIIARALPQKSRAAVVEDPCLDSMSGALRKNGYELLPVGVDAQGMMTSDLWQHHAGLIYVVPSHQFPTGGVLPAPRRLELLRYAAQNGSLIIEDDYDSEFRYDGEPIQPLHSLDPERVVYLGSLSKTFSPSLRVAYAIASPEITRAMRRHLYEMNLCVPVIEQLALASFIRQGLLERHIYRMKKVYAGKRALLIKELTSAFGDEIRIVGQNAGLHMLVLFEHRMLTERDFERMESHGVAADWSKDYCLTDQSDYRNGIILGYGALDDGQIIEGIKRLRESLSKYNPTDVL